ncbi:MAG: hypothetical protein NTY66_02615 [Candidatus Vogelbacteria bacterium]|nr:hypothetical protein [Candidatus Vogelbacteria bacterium]
MKKFIKVFAICIAVLPILMMLAVCDLNPLLYFYQDGLNKWLDQVSQGTLRVLVIFMLVGYPLGAAYLQFVSEPRSRPLRE